MNGLPLLGVVLDWTIGYCHALDGLFGPFPSDEHGWVEYEIEDGAELLFPSLD